MHYVKHFNINGVDTKQVACIELPGKPNTATEGAVGLLGIDMSSPLHEIYKCVAVNGSIYTWELFSSGLSIVSAIMSGKGEESVLFPYDNLKIPLTYMVKPGDLIFDSEGYIYQVDSLDALTCNATYCGTRVVAYGMSAYDLAVKEGFEGSLEDWFLYISGERSVIPFEATSTDGISYAVTIGGVSELYNGLTINVVPNRSSVQPDIKLNLNGFGAKAVRLSLPDKSCNSGILATDNDWFGANAPITLRYYTEGDVWKADLNSSQKPWDVKENVGSIVSNVEHDVEISDKSGWTVTTLDEALPSGYSSYDTEWRYATKNVLTIPMINTGDICIKHRHELYMGSFVPHGQFFIKVYVNDEVAYNAVILDYTPSTTTDPIGPSGVVTTPPIKVNKGDSIRISTEMKYLYGESVNLKYENLPFGEQKSYIRDIDILANIDTPYKYVSLFEATDPSTAEILNTLLGV